MKATDNTFLYINAHAQTSKTESNDYILSIQTFPDAELGIWGSETKG